MSKSQRIFLGIAVLLTGLSLFWGADRFSMTPFREAQTAITAYYMASGESPFLAYEVPVLGREWAVPMEFPIFQWLVARLSAPDIVRIMWTGRSLSLLFWLLCLWVCHLILNQAPLEKDDRIWALLLLALVPIFVAYSTTFLIESLALLFALLYLWCTLQLLQSGALLKWFLPGVVAGSLAALTKPTTWASFAGVVALMFFVTLCNARKRPSSTKDWGKFLLNAFGLLVLPLSAALWWVHLGDEIKLLNPLAQGLVSDNLSAWNYGTLAQKLSPRVWAVVLGKQFTLLFGPLFFLAVPLLVYAFFLRKNKAWPGKASLWIFIAVAGYGSAPIVFTNLHFRHDYYLFANGFFLIAAFAVALSKLRVSWSGKTIQRIWILVCVSASLTSLGYMGIRKMFQEPAEERIVEVIRSLPEEGPVIFLGFGWSSNMPYFSERRALMTGQIEPDSERFQQIVQANKNEPWAAIVTASPALAETAALLNDAFQLELTHTTELWPGITLHSRSEVAAHEDSEAQTLMSRLESRFLRTVLPESNLIQLHSPFSRRAGAESWLEIVFRRGSELYILNGSQLSFIRIKGYFEPPVLETVTE